jgi:hypothetical protein
MNTIAIFAVALSLFTMALPSASAAETVLPANQPNNGFYEGRDPEWATLHSTDARGTTEHRQYHRDAAQEHLTWHTKNQSGQGTSVYAIAHRLYHQVRNALHRQFHSDSAQS